MIASTPMPGVDAKWQADPEGGCYVPRTHGSSRENGWSPPTGRLEAARSVGLHRDRSDRSHVGVPPLRLRPRRRPGIRGVELREHPQRPPAGCSRRTRCACVAGPRARGARRVGADRRPSARCLPRDDRPQPTSCGGRGRLCQGGVPHLQRAEFRGSGVGHRARRLRGADQRISRGGGARFGVPPRQDRGPPDRGAHDRPRSRPELDLCILGGRYGHRRPGRAPAARAARLRAYRVRGPGRAQVRRGIP